MALAVAAPAAAGRVPRPQAAPQSCSSALLRASRQSCRTPPRALARPASRSGAVIAAAAGGSPIRVVRQASAEEVARLGCKSWPTWACGVSRFPWSYGETETSLLIEGAVTVTPDGGEPVSLVAGDIAVFPAGLSCTWHVTQPLRKHYSFDA